MVTPIGSYIYSAKDTQLTRDEVEYAIYRAKVGKAMGLDNIQSVVTKSEVCAELLYSVMSHSFE